jgi:hypothetical protein
MAGASTGRVPAACKNLCASSRYFGRLHGVISSGLPIAGSTFPRFVPSVRNIGPWSTSGQFRLPLQILRYHARTGLRIGGPSPQSRLRPVAPRQYSRARQSTLRSRSRLLKPPSTACVTTTSSSEVFCGIERRLDLRFRPCSTWRSRENTHSVTYTAPPSWVDQKHHAARRSASIARRPVKSARFFSVVVMARACSVLT